MRYEQEKSLPGISLHVTDEGSLFVCFNKGKYRFDFDDTVLRYGPWSCSPGDGDYWVLIAPGIMTAWGK